MPTVTAAIALPVSGRLGLALLRRICIKLALVWPAALAAGRAVLFAIS